METTESLRHRIDTAQALRSIVMTMKALATASIHKCELAVESLAGYNRSLELGMYVVLQAGPGPMRRVRTRTAGHLAAVIFGTDHGLCGPFNDDIATHALAELDRLEPRPACRTVLGVGTRLADLLTERGQPLAAVLNTPSSLGGVTPLVQDLLVRIDHLRVRQERLRVLIVYNRHLAGAPYSPKTVQLLPIDLERFRHLPGGWPSRALPTFSMGREQLLTALIRQYLFVGLYRAAAESLTSEHATRLLSMQSAERNIDERLEEFTVAHRRLRQESITHELLDIAAGFEALSGP